MDEGRVQKFRAWGRGAPGPLCPAELPVKRSAVFPPGPTCPIPPASSLLITEHAYNSFHAQELGAWPAGRPVRTQERDSLYFAPTNTVFHFTSVQPKVR